MVKQILRPKQAGGQNIFGGIHQDCPPEEPYQLYVNAALFSVGEEYTDAIGELDEDTMQLVSDIITSAVHAALNAAQVPNEWGAMVKQRQATPAQPHQHPIEPCWHYDTIDHPIGLYQSMAWHFQQEELPNLFRECGSHTDQQQAKLIEAFDSMLALALTAAGVDSAWDKLYEATKQKLGGAQ